MDSTTKELLKKLRTTGSAIIRYESHFNFLSECIERNQISKEFQKKTSVTYEALKRGCQKIQDDASWEQQKQTRDWLGPEVKNLKRKFNKIKSKLFLVAKERAGRL